MAQKVGGEAETGTDKARRAALSVNAVNRVFPKAVAFYICLAWYVARDKRAFRTTRRRLKHITGIGADSSNSDLITKCLNVLCEARWIKKRVVAKRVQGKDGGPPKTIRHLVITFLIRSRRPEAYRPGDVGRGQAVNFLRRRIRRDQYYKELIKGHEDVYDRMYLKDFLRWLVHAKTIPVPDARSVFGGPALVWADEKLRDFRLKLMFDEQAQDMVIAVEKKDGRDWVQQYLFLGLSDALKQRAAEVEAALAKVLRGEDYRDVDGVPFYRWAEEPPAKPKPRFIEEPAKL